MAAPALFHNLAGPLNRHASQPSGAARLELPGARTYAPPQSQVPTLDSPEAPWLNEAERSFSALVRAFLMDSRKLSIRMAYLAKWKRFTLWSLWRKILPLEAPLPVVLDYLHYLKKEGLAVSSIRIHFAAISAFHPVANGQSVFSNPICARFLKGLECLYLQVHQCLPPWDLNRVVSRLMGPPFEPVATCPLLYLSRKTS